MAFDEQGEPIPATPFDYDVLDRATEQDNDAEKMRSELFLLAWRMICRPESSMTQMARDLHLALYFMGRDFETLAELAEKFGVSRPRMTALVNSFQRRHPLIVANSNRGR